MTNQVQTAPSTLEVTINTLTGTASITRVGLARRLNVPTQTLKDYLNRRGKTQGNQPLMPSDVIECVNYFASSESKYKNPTAVALLKYLTNTPDWTINDLNNFEHTLPKKRDTSGFIYLVQCHDYYKIGMSKTSVEDRVKSFETGNPYPVSLVFYKQVKNAYRAENNTHHKFKKYHHKNEWFTGFDVEEVITFMESIR